MFDHTASDHRWRSLAALFVARTAMSYQYQSVGSLSSFLTEDLQIDFAQVGFLIGLYQLPGVLLAFPGGLLGKRFGDKRVAVIGLGLTVVGALAMAFGESFTSVAGARLVSGIGGILFNVLAFKMAADWFAGREIVTAMAILVTSWPLGIALALISLGPLAVASSWSLAMVATASVCLVAVLALAAAYRTPPAAAPDQQSTSQSGIGLSRREALLAALAGLVWMLFSVGYALLPGFAPGFFISKGYTVAEAGSMVSLVGWILVLSLPLGGHLAERLGRPNLFLVACLVGTGVATCLLPFWSYPILLLVVLGLLYGPPPGIIVSLPVEVVRPENRAPGMGIFYTCSYGGMAVLPAVAGYSRDVTGDPGAPLIFSGILLLLAVAVFGLFRAVQRHG